jgi:molybdopterin converting factor small subunit
VSVKRDRRTLKIYVKLFATLVQHAPQTVVAQQAGMRGGQRFEWELPEDGTLTHLIEALALPRQEIKVAFVNGRARELDYRLRAGDEVGIFSPIGGG